MTQNETPDLVYAVDPGTRQSAIVALLPESAGGKPAIVVHDILPNALLLEFLAGVHQPGAALVVEMISSYGAAVGREVFETCVWIGRFLQAFPRKPGYTVATIRRRDVKRLLGLNTSAKDSVVRQHLLDLYTEPAIPNPIGSKKAPGPLYGVARDEWQAMALGLALLDSIWQTCRYGPSVAGPPEVTYYP